MPKNTKQSTRAITRTLRPNLVTKPNKQHLEPIFDRFEKRLPVSPQKPDTERFGQLFDSRSKQIEQIRALHNRPVQITEQLMKAVTKMHEWFPNKMGRDSDNQQAKTNHKNQRSQLIRLDQGRRKKGLQDD
ncbi:MAG: hypothetical protein OXF60_11845 [Gammaproteobacteria bacterium]|nr:hypothetical protein [Gammaproteobacteria bacterium]